MKSEMLEKGAKLFNSLPSKFQKGLKRLKKLQSESEEQYEREMIHVYNCMINGYISALADAGYLELLDTDKLKKFVDEVL